MPKVGMEEMRRKALIGAAVDAIHVHGFCDVTVSKIAKRAGVSSGLAHHYFGSKADLLAATMRSLLTDLGEGIRQRVRLAGSPRARVSAIVDGNFAPDQFQPAVIAAWLAFYVQAQTSENSRRLLKIYSKRLISNLTFHLKELTDHDHAFRIAEGIAALIDGFYIRRGLKDGPPDPHSAIRIIEDYIEIQLRARP
ncbi:transcriptional regulator BetI [Coralliovum pocilloporae]|uniref:transcriptional regulator BetI n=1 Tax=Coralliovum pocilloporae TaxID=3066369 RepID=UPI003307C40F